MVQDKPETAQIARSRVVWRRLGQHLPAQSSQQLTSPLSHLRLPCLDKTSRERVKQASRDLLASKKARLANLDRFWEKKQTKANVEVFILDEVFASLSPPPFTPDEKKALAASVSAHVWQQAVNGGFVPSA